MATWVRDLSVLVVVHLLGFVISLAIGSGAPSLFGLAVPVWIFIGVFLVQWLAFVVAYRLQTEHFFDLVGGLSFIVGIIAALLLTGHYSNLQLGVVALVCIWALRLTIFLFVRVQRLGHDRRFADIKPDPVRFFTAWALQGLWVILTLAAALTLVTDPTAKFSTLGGVGIGLWLLGFAIEVFADWQKSAFRAAAENKDKFIHQGLWAYSRHPNYLGEILLWLGLFLIALPNFDGWQWAGMISPLFVYVLLRYVSGVPLLEARADAQWGDDADYQAYKGRTPALLGFLKD